MTVIATASNPRFWVSRVDIDRGGPTYTIDTLRDLHARCPDAELYFITGADALAEIFTWRDAEELFAMAKFVGCTRPGFVMDAETLGKIPPTGSRWSRCRRWRSARRTAGDVRCGASRSGTSCPTASSSTSPSTSCTRARLTLSTESAA